MWLAYLRFDSATETRIALVHCGSKQETNSVIDAAKQFRTWVLTEYASFYAHAKIHSRDVPNFSEELIYTAEDFLRKCGAWRDSPESGPGSPSSNSQGRVRQPAIENGRPQLPRS